MRYLLWLSHPAANESLVLSQVRGLAAGSDLQVKQHPTWPDCKYSHAKVLTTNGTWRLLKVVNTPKVACGFKGEKKQTSQMSFHVLYSKTSPFKSPPDRSARFYRSCERQSCDVCEVCFRGSSVFMFFSCTVYLTGPDVFRHPTVTTDSYVILAWTLFWPSLPSSFALYLPVLALFPQGCALSRTW